MIAVLNWLLNHWWVFFWLAIFGVFEGVRDFFIGIAEAVGGVFTLRHDRKVELARAKAEGEPPPTAALPVPGPCRHRKAVPVRTSEGDVVAWLCRACDTKLPADFSIYEEDL